jgi:hypothetical protein
VAAEVRVRTKEEEGRETRKEESAVDLVKRSGVQSESQSHVSLTKEQVDTARSAGRGNCKQSSSRCLTRCDYRSALAPYPARICEG